MKKLIAPLSGVLMSALVGIAVAHAQPTPSCSAAGENCRGAVRARAPAGAPASALAPYIDKCDKAEQSCKSACNKDGTSVYVSNFDGSSHPAASCK